MKNWIGECYLIDQIVNVLFVIKLTWLERVKIEAQLSLHGCESVILIFLISLRYKSSRFRRIREVWQMINRVQIPIIIRSCLSSIFCIDNSWSLLHSLCRSTDCSPKPKRMKILPYKININSPRSYILKCKFSHLIISL